MSSNTTTTTNSDLPKVVITLGVLAGALIIGLIVAKLADYLYERSSVRDDASDISEHTRELLKTQLELMRMGKTKDKKDDKKDDDPEAEKEKATKAMGMWSNKVKAKAKLNPIPESGEAGETGGEAVCTADTQAKAKDSKGKGKANPAVTYQVSEPTKKDEAKKYHEAVKVWNEVEKNSQSKSAANANAGGKNKNEKASTVNKGQAAASKGESKKGESSLKEKSVKVGESSNKKSAEGSPSKSSSKDDNEFDIPVNIPAATTSKPKAEKKNSKSVLIPDNLTKNTDIRPLTAGKVEEGMPGYMRPKTPFSPRNFSRYNGTVDPMRSTSDKNSSGTSKAS